MIQQPSSLATLPVPTLLEVSPLFELNGLEQKLVPALKMAFNQWIRSLPMEERFLALKIYSGDIPQVLRKILGRLDLLQKERGSEGQIAKIDTPSKKEGGSQGKRAVRKISKSFWQSLVFISDGRDFIDHICFEFGLLECPEKLFDLLVLSLDSPSAKLMLQGNENKEEIPMVIQKLLACSCLESVATVTLTYLRQEVLLRFRSCMLHSDFLSKGLEEERRRKKEISLHLKHLSQDLKKKMVLLGFKDVVELQEWLGSHEIGIELRELESEVEELTKLEKNEFSSRIFKCKLKKVTSQMVAYHERIYNLWKKQASKARKRKFSKNINADKVEKVEKDSLKVEEETNSHSKKKSMHRKSVSVESNQTSATERDKGNQKQKAVIQFEEVQSFFSPKVEEGECKIETSKELEELTVIGTAEINLPRHKKIMPKEEDFEIEAEKKLSMDGSTVEEEEEFPTCSSLPDGETEEEMLQKRSMSEKVREMGLMMATEQLMQFVDKISEQANCYHQRRIIAFERIQFLLSYYYVKIELFGSCASGIAIEDSDVDIAVKNEILGYFQYVPDHLKLHAALENLQQVFSAQPFISEVKLIGTASIPIIKLKVDTSVTCLNPQFGETFTTLNREHNGGLIEADITIETLNVQSQSNHLGIISTQAINEWLQEIPTLRCIILALKRLLQSRDLHKTYQGGLNTFSMTVLVVCYIYHAELQKETNPALVFQRILSFYACQFDEKQTGIDFLNHGQSSIFYPKKMKEQVNEESHFDTLERADLELSDPICQGKNITRKCYLFPEIKEFFKQVLDTCFHLPQGEKLEKQGRQGQNRFQLLLTKQ